MRVKLGWCDRFPVKQDILYWINSEEQFYVLSTLSSFELKDISGWINENIETYEVFKVILESSTELSGFEIMKSLVSLLGEDNFPEFRSKYSKYDVEPNIIINQTIAKDISAGTDAGIKENSQVVNLPEKSLKHDYFEKNKNDFLGAFINDIRDIERNKQLLFIFNYFGEGYSKVKSDFNNWFSETFLERIRKKTGIKVCVLCENDFDKLDQNDEFWSKQLNNLTEHELLDGVKEHFPNVFKIVGAAMIDKGENTLPYEVFKYKLTNAVKAKQ